MFLHFPLESPGFVYSRGQRNEQVTLNGIDNEKVRGRKWRFCREQLVLFLTLMFCGENHMFPSESFCVLDNFGLIDCVWRMQS